MKVVSQLKRYYFGKCAFGTGLVTLTSLKFSCCTAKCADIEVRNAIERTLYVAVLKYWGAGNATRPSRALGPVGKQPADEMLEHGRAACTFMAICQQSSYLN